MFLKPKVAEGEDADPYDTNFYRRFRAFLGSCIRYRVLTIGAVVGAFVLSLAGFGKVEQSFFPNSTRPQFMVDYWLPQGTHIDETVSAAAEVEQYLLGLEHVTHVSTLAGAGGLRFLLPLALADQGVMVSIGAHGQREGLASHWEMWTFAQGGFSSIEALATATIVPARALGMDHDLGSIETGKSADFAVLDEDPLSVGPGTLKDVPVWGTIVGGRVFPCEQIGTG